MSDVAANRLKSFDIAAALKLLDFHDRVRMTADERCTGGPTPTDDRARVSLSAAIIAAAVGTQPTNAHEFR